MPSSIRPRRSPSPRAVAPPTVPARQISSTLGQRRKSSPRSLASAAADDTVVSMLQVSVDAQPSEPRPEIHARLDQLPHRRDAGADAQVAPRIVLHAGARLGEEPDLVGVEPHRVHERGLRLQEAELGQVAHESLAVLDEPGHDLQPCLLHVDDHRQIELVRQPPRLAQESLGATLGRRRGDDEADAPLARVPLAREPPAKREELLGRGARIRGERLCAPPPETLPRRTAAPGRRACPSC